MYLLVIAHPIIFNVLHSHSLNLTVAYHVIGGLLLLEIVIDAVEEGKSSPLEAEGEESKPDGFIQSLENFMELGYHIEDLANSHTVGKVGSKKLSLIYMLT